MNLSPSHVVRYSIKVVHLRESSIRNLEDLISKYLLDNNYEKIFENCELLLKEDSNNKLALLVKKQTLEYLNQCILNYPVNNETKELCELVLKYFPSDILASNFLKKWEQQQLLKNMLSKLANDPKNPIFLFTVVEIYIEMEELKLAKQYVGFAENCFMQNGSNPKEVNYQATIQYIERINKLIQNQFQGKQIEEKKVTEK